MIFCINAHKSHMNTHAKNQYFWTTHFLLIEQYVFCNIVIGKKNRKKKLIITKKNAFICHNLKNNLNVI